MTDWKRAVLLIEYDDGAQNAYEFTELIHADLTHSGLPGPATILISGRVAALRKPGSIEQQFIEGIIALTPGATE